MDLEATSHGEKIVPNPIISKALILVDGFVTSVRNVCRDALRQRKRAGFAQSHRFKTPSPAGFKIVERPKTADLMILTDNVLK